MKRLTEYTIPETGFSVVSEEKYKRILMEEKPSVEKVYNRLKKIEDILGDEYDLDELREMVQAKREGRCGIPPVKMHQKLFRVFNGEIYEETVCGAMWEPLMPRPRWKVFAMGSGLAYYWDDVFGKTVFLSHEEAEAALRREQE